LEDLFELGRDGSFGVGSGGRRRWGWVEREHDWEEGGHLGGKECGRGGKEKEVREEAEDCRDGRVLRAFASGEERRRIRLRRRRFGGLMKEEGREGWS